MVRTYQKQGQNGTNRTKMKSGQKKDKKKDKKWTKNGQN